MGDERVSLEERWRDEDEDEGGIRLVKAAPVPMPAIPEPKEVPGPRTPAPKR